MGVGRSIVTAAIVTWLVAAVAGQVSAAPPADKILPTTTVVYLGFPDFPTVRDKWGNTQIGKFIDDPAMAEFVQHFKDRLREELESGPAGLTVDEAADLPSGATAFAISRDSAGKSIEWAVVDVTNQKVKVDAVLGKVKARLTKANAKARTAKAGDVTITVYDVPADPKAAPGTPAASATRRLTHFERDNLLVFCSHEGAAIEVATRWNKEPAKALAGSATYKAVIDRLAKDQVAGQPGAGEPDVWLFLRPMAYAETVRADFPRKAPAGEPDLLQVMRNQKFHEIYGIGGTGHLEQGKFDAVIRAAAFAPRIQEAIAAPAANQPAAQALQNALRMLAFVNAEPSQAQDWLPSGVGTYIDMTWDTQTAFKGFGSFFDEYMEEPGSWQDLIDSVREDPNGPGIDLNKNLIALLANRVSIVSRFVLPAGIDSRQKLIIVETTDPVNLAKNIAASLKGDPKVKTRQFEGVELHEIHDQQAPQAPGAVPPGGKKAVKIPPTAIAVAHNALLISTHVSLMEDVIKKANADGAVVKEYAAAIKELTPLLPPPFCLGGWFDAAKNAEPSFELMRAGQLGNDHSLIGEILRMLAESGKRNLKLDGTKLPPFAQVKQHFTGGGFAVKVEPKFGWFGKAYVLKSGQPVAAPAAEAPAPATPGNE